MNILVRARGEYYSLGIDTQFGILMGMKRWILFVCVVLLGSSFLVEPLSVMAEETDAERRTRIETQLQKIRCR